MTFSDDDVLKMAAVTSTRDFPDVGGGLKCGKCRSTTLVRKGQFLEDTEDSNLWTLDQDHLPEWIQTAVDESGWTKGRIACPNCQCRIGAFDFVGGADNPVHLVKSKVDRSIGSTESSEITQTLEKRTLAAAAGAAAAAAAPLTPETTAIPAAVATSSSTEGDTISVTAPESKSLALEVTSSAVAASATAEVTSSDTTADISSMATPLADQHQPITMSDNDNDDEDANAALPSVSLTTGNGSGSIEAVADDVIGEEDDVHDEEPFEDASGDEEEEDVDATEADVVQMDFLVDGASGDMRLLSAASTTAEAAAAAAAASAGNRRAIKRSKMTLGQVGSHKKSLMKTKQEREEKFIQEILNSEPELDDMDPSLICPVCLDLLHDPYSALPCKHTFCETCLRRLGSKNAMDTTCPMCRQRILFCDLQSDLSKTIKLQFPEMYEKRKKFERSSANGNLSVYNMPLPWRPGWRNLISGRPMGGNAFDTRGSTAELFRRVVQQLPYYIPPVVLANLINLVFFVFLLFAVEVVPTLISLLMKTKKSSLPNVALQPPPPPAASFNPADKAGAVGGANGAAAAGSSTVSVADAAAAAAAAAAQAIHGDAIGASGEIQDYEDGSVDVATTSAAALDESILSAAAAAAASAVSASSASGSSDLPDDGQGFFPHSGDGIGGGGGGGVGIGPGGGGVDGSISNGMVMDTTFYYALYLVLFAGTLLGNFFLLNHPTSLIPRGSILERWFYHPRWGRFNRRVFDVLLVLVLTSIPIVTLPLVFSSSSSMMTSPAQGGVAAAEATIATMTSSTTSSSSSKTLLDAWLTRLVDYCTAFFAFPYFFVGIAVVWMVSVYFFDCHDDPVE